jgi:hypothetical protein
LVHNLGDYMSYNVESAGTNHAVHLQVSSTTTISSGDAIPYAVVNGTTGHGVTVSNGVVTLPRGEWSLIASAETDTPQAFEAQWYVNSLANSDFPKIVEYSATTTSNLGSTALVTQGSRTVELRVNAGVTIEAYSDMIIYGVKL